MFGSGLSSMDFAYDPGFWLGSSRLAFVDMIVMDSDPPVGLSRVCFMSFPRFLKHPSKGTPPALG